MTPKIKMQSIVLDCKDINQLADFYVKLLGGEIAFDIEGYFKGVSVEGENIRISVQYDPDYAPPIFPGSVGEQAMMEHMDFSADDVDAAAEYAQSIGAVKSGTQFWQEGYGPRWITMLDPAGHPFCLCGQE